MKVALGLCAAASALLQVQGIADYLGGFPNGDKPTFTTNPLGHANGVPGLDPFAVDWDGAGRTWSINLCQADSDGDGVSNGAEMGDPDCVSVNGGTPPAGLPLGDPGNPAVQPAAAGGGDGTGTNGEGSTAGSDAKPFYEDPAVLAIGGVGIGIIGLAVFVRSRNSQQGGGQGAVGPAYGGPPPGGPPQGGYGGYGGYPGGGGGGGYGGYPV